MRLSPHRHLVALLAGTALVPAADAQLVFEPPQSIGAPPFARRVLVADVVEDGVPDLVTSRSQFFPVFGFAELNVGLGAGQFGAAQSLGIWDAFQLADFDGDTHLDLLVGGGWPENEKAVSIKFGDGAGGFGPFVGISVGNSGQDPDDAAVGDFDADGALDVVVHRGVEPFLGGRIMVIFGHGDGTFDEPLIVVPFAGMGLSDEDKGRVQVGDLDADGLDDFVYTNGQASPVMFSQGDGSFVFGPCTGPGCGLTTDRDFVLVDVNGDGRDDAVSNKRVLLTQADGTLGPGQIFPTSFVPFAVAVADLDGDGHDDVALGRNGITAELDTTATAGDVLLLRGAGDGTFQTAGVVVSHVPQPRGLSPADLDGDGRIDLAAAVFQPANGVRALMNHTYGPGSPFLDLGGALAGAAGLPIQLADGTLVAGAPFSFALANGPANGFAFHFVGLSELGAPFKGGVLVPAVDLINGPLPLDGAGGLELTGPWPAGGSGATIWLQFWMPNGGGPKGWVASSGVRASIP